jgi:hypothetical protein
MRKENPERRSLIRNQSIKRRSGDNEIGKGRPPLETRWKPGQSGNPRGRPKARRRIGHHRRNGPRIHRRERWKVSRSSSILVAVRRGAGIDLSPACPSRIVVSNRLNSKLPRGRWALSVRHANSCIPPPTMHTCPSIHPSVKANEVSQQRRVSGNSWSPPELQYSPPNH